MEQKCQQRASVQHEEQAQNFAAHQIATSQLISIDFANAVEASRSRGAHKSHFDTIHSSASHEMPYENAEPTRAGAANWNE
ncbi:unnamed protein product [Gongylonema pulchrum]|uniref:Uncharacterized protein n=1 Tax=Gongylonema pulchrum TaxID=637853 RepID=A0A183E8Z1_9BILA|nr:unnamed protein product [Gongylonema pulchrum]